MNEVKTSQPSQRLDIERIRQQLGTALCGSGNHIVYLSSVPSTNIYAMQLARDGSEEGVVVLTDNQTAGKGRQGRHWVGRVGCDVLSSVILRPLFPPYLLVMVASLALVETISETCGVAATIKWPNDVLIQGRKVSGILIETSHDHMGKLFAILGIGVNCNGHSEPLASSITDRSGSLLRPTTLEDECGQELVRETFLVHLLTHLEDAYLTLQNEAQHAHHFATGTGVQQLSERWKAHLSTLGQTVQARQGDRVISGFAEDVNERGELLLRTPSGEQITISWGDVE